LSKRSPSGTRKKVPAKKAAEGQRRHPSRSRRVGLELRGERAEHRRLVVDGSAPANTDTREQDHQAAA